MRLPPGVQSPVEAVVVGVPYDGGASFRPGARFGPRAIREASSLLSATSIEGRGDLTRLLRVSDGGDLNVSPYSQEQMSDEVATGIGSIISYGAVPLVIGGDHSISLPLLRAVASHHGPVALVHFDAHSDTSQPTPEGNDHHGTPFRKAIEEGLVDPSRMVQVGLRGTCRELEGLEWARERGVTVITMSDFAEAGYQAAACRIRTVAGAGPVHVSFDIDVVDPAFAPGTGTPVPGGMSSRDALGTIQSLAPLSVISADVVEVCPAYDVSSITSLLAASIVYETLWLMVGSAGSSTSPRS